MRRKERYQCNVWQSRDLLVGARRRVSFAVFPTMAQADTSGPSISINDIRRAAEEIKPFIHRTPAVVSSTADDLASSSSVSLRLVMKCENLQKVGGETDVVWWK
jgi:hypothetical protein